MIIQQKFQTPKGVVAIKRVYKNLKGTKVEAISETFVDAPFEDEAVLDKFHRWAANQRSTDKLHNPSDEILELVGGSWEEIAE